MAQPPNRIEVENLILAYFPNCPFCKGKEMEFTWGHLVPKRMTCKNCGASWEPLMSYDRDWGFTAAKLVTLGENKKGSNLINRMYSANFWKRMSRSISIEESKEIEQKLKGASGEPTKIVIVREVVKIRCPYCGGLYNEVNDKCPYCGGKR
jgi:hypothetical protein